MAKQKDQVPQNEGVPATVGSPKADDMKAQEEDGENRLLSDGDFMDRSRLMGNE